jgi:hypothetical protein
MEPPVPVVVACLILAGSLEKNELSRNYDCTYLQPMVAYLVFDTPINATDG